MLKNNPLRIITQITLVLFALVVTACAIALLADARMLTLYMELFGFKNAFGFFVFIFAAAALALWVLTELFLIMRTVGGDPFVMKNVKAFVRTGIISELAGLLFIVKCFYVFTVMTAACAAVMVLAGMFSFVLSMVFRRAVWYKQENDLTI